MSRQTPAAAVVDYLIVGGGPAGATAADALRREGAAGSVTILSAEDMAPYHRQRLSKGYLVGSSSADEMRVYPMSFYDEQKIDLRLGVRVARVDTKQRHVHTTAGEVIRYKQMLLAPGAAPRSS
jgi:NTE family protein